MKASDMRKFTSIRHDRWAADRWQVIFSVRMPAAKGGTYNMRFAVGAEMENRKYADRIRRELDAALAQMFNDCAAEKGGAA